MRSLRSHRSNPEPPTTLTVPARNAHIETFARPTSRAESRRSPSPVTGRLWASGSRSPSPEVTREATCPDEVPEEVSGTPINKSRAQPPTTGQHVGLCAARKAQKEAEREQEELRAQRVAGLETRRLTRVAISLLATDKNITPTVRRETAQNLQSHITGALADISEVAKVSKGLKGTCANKLKKAVAAIEEITEEFLNRTTDDEITRLRAHNKRLESEIRDLSNEVAKMRIELAEARLPRPSIPAFPANCSSSGDRPPTWLQALIAEIRSPVGPNINAPPRIEMEENAEFPPLPSPATQRSATRLPATHRPAVQPSTKSSSQGRKPKATRAKKPVSSSGETDAPAPPHTAVHHSITLHTTTLCYTRRGLDRSGEKEKEQGPEKGGKGRPQTNHRTNPERGKG
ncbi:hypothetical protein K1T71_014718 [Dendrolimus kikuchii]|nr:hypothetical protein K1T71_014718 [Dendrolimus kikuchii]